MKTLIVILLLSVTTAAQTATPPLVLTCDTTGCKASAVTELGQILPILQSINTSVAAILAEEQKSLAAQQDIDKAVTSVSTTAASAWAWFGKYIGIPLGTAITTYIATKKL